MIKTVLVAAALVAGCTYVQYREKDAEFSRWSVGTSLELSEISASSGVDGTRTIRAAGYKSDQVEALKAVAEGAARGAVGAVAP